MVAVRVRYAEAALWLVSGHLQAAALTALGVHRWRVWTLAELNSLLAACGSPVHTLQQAAAVLQCDHD